MGIFALFEKLYFCKNVKNNITTSVEIKKDVILASILLTKKPLLHAGKDGNFHFGEI
jgi:hypothetical protein